MVLLHGVTGIQRNLLGSLVGGTSYIEFAVGVIYVDDVPTTMWSLSASQGRMVTVR